MSVNTLQLAQVTLNNAQQKCVEDFIGQYIVLAGAGTGKTTVIIKRIENMISNGIEPSSILVLTYSFAAANEMKIRLLSSIGAQAASVVISTYHAFCNDIINENILKFELYENYKIIDDLNKYRLMRETLDECSPKYLVTIRNDPYFYIKPLIDAINEIKLNRISKGKYFDTIESHSEWKPKLRQLLEEKENQLELEKLGKRNRLKTTIKEFESLQNTINKAQEVWKIYELYDKKLKRDSLIDFNDMINLVLDKFEEDPEFLNEIKGQFNYIMVDEYQDTNYSQNELIFKLAGTDDDTNIFVVGDDDQIIYTFQGARVDNIQNFIEKYPTCKLICLTENNRSTQRILDLSYGIISQDSQRLENNQDLANKNINKKLLAANSNLASYEKNAQLHIFSERIQEVNFIVDKIDSLIELNPESKLSEIAIIARTNNELKEFAEQLRHKNIAFQIYQQKDIFSLKASIIIYLYLKAVVNPVENASGLFGITSLAPFNFNPDDYTFILKELHKHQSDFISIIKANLSKRKWKDYARIEHFINTFTNISMLASNDSIGSLIVTLINEARLLEFFFSTKINRFENISSINKLIEEANNFENNNKLATLESFLLWLENSIRDDIEIKIDENAYVENAVQLITVHKAKGREFDNVFLTNLSSSNWEKKKSLDKLKVPIEKPTFSKESEVARLLYVSCTRARKSLYLSYFTSSKSKTNEISAFISNINSNKSLIDSIIHNINTESHLNEIKTFLFKSDLFDDKLFLDVIKERASYHHMSPTSLNDYNACPKLFLFKYIYKIPLPETYNRSFSFGIAVHEALEKYLQFAIKNKKYSGKDALLKYFNKATEKQPFQSIQERDSSTIYGRKVLDALYSSLIAIDIDSIEALEARYSQIPYNNHYITGRIDRLQKLDDNKVSVIDYKTGSAKTESSVISDEGDYNYYYDQLRFYKVLVEINSPKKSVSKGVIYFVENPEKSIYIDLTEDDKKIISEKIDIAYSKILNLEFFGIDEENQQGKPCKNCSYKMICKLNAL